MRECGLLLFIFAWKWKIFLVKISWLIHRPFGLKRESEQAWIIFVKGFRQLTFMLNGALCSRASSACVHTRAQRSIFGESMQVRLKSTLNILLVGKVVFCSNLLDNFTE